MKTMKFPSAARLKEMRRKLARVKGSEGLPPDATAVDRAKYYLCQELLIHMHRSRMSQRQFAKTLGVPESRVSEIVHYRIKRFTLDKLVQYHEKLNPDFRLKVA